MLLFIITWIILGILGISIPAHYIDKIDVKVSDILLGIVFGYFLFLIGIVYIFMHLVTSVKFTQYLKIVIIPKSKKGET